MAPNAAANDSCWWRLACIGARIQTTIKAIGVAHNLREEPIAAATAIGQAIRAIVPVMNVRRRFSHESRYTHAMSPLN
jgi:hypothetical protein